MVFADQQAMRNALVLILIFMLSAGSLLAQGELDEQKRVMLRDERTFGGFLNSNGWGANYRYGYWRNARNQFIIDGDFAYVKHPKEYKTTIAYNYSTYRYVLGKENLFWELKGMAGWQKELYRKIDKTGILSSSEQSRRDVTKSVSKGCLSFVNKTRGNKSPG